LTRRPTSSYEREGGEKEGGEGFFWLLIKISKTAKKGGEKEGGIPYPFPYFSRACESQTQFRERKKG